MTRTSSVRRPIRRIGRFVVLALLVVPAGAAAQSAQSLPATSAITTAGPVVGASMTLVWSAVPEATHYHVRLADAVGIQLDDYFRPDQVGCAAGSVCELTVATVNYTPGPGQWWVQAWSPTAEGPWSDHEGIHLRGHRTGRHAGRRRLGGGQLGQLGRHDH